MLLSELACWLAGRHKSPAKLREWLHDRWRLEPPFAMAVMLEAKTPTLRPETHALPHAALLQPECGAEKSKMVIDACDNDPLCLLASFGTCQRI